MSTSVCRVCLHGNVRMLYIKDRKLREIYETLTHSKLIRDDGRSTAMCYICVSQLQRCRRLSDMACHSETTLTQSLRSGIGITPSYVIALDKRENQPKMTDITHMTVIDESINSMTLVKEEPEVAVKEEIAEVEELDDDTDNDDIGLSQITPSNVIALVKRENQHFILTDIIHVTVIDELINSMTLVKEEPEVTVKEEKAKVDELYDDIDSDDIGLSQVESPQSKHMTDKYHSTNRMFHVKVEQEAVKEEIAEVEELEAKIENDDIGGQVEQPQVNESNEAKHSNMKSYIYCETCNKKFASKSNLINHLRIHTGEKPYACNECKKAFGRGGQLKCHILSHTGEKPYACEECTKAFSRAEDFKSHMISHTGEKVYACNECNKAFSLACNLKSHMLIHAGENPYACKECNKAFRRGGDLNRHMLIHAGEKPYACNECNKAFSLAGSLKSHMLIHAGEKPYACKECNKAFRRGGDLNRHMLSHSREKPYACKECNKAFRRGGDLKTHMLIHAGEKPYACKECNKTFRRGGELKCHMLSHSREKPFACNQCNKAFSRADALKSHKLSHTGEKPYGCNICSKAFNHPSTLRRHNMFRHAGEEPYE